MHNNSEEGIALLSLNSPNDRNRGEKDQPYKHNESQNKRENDCLCTALVFSLGFISTAALIIACLHLLIVKNERNNILLGSMSHTVHFSIHIDKGVNADILYVIDNFPIPSPPSVAKIIPILSSRSSSNNKIWESLSQSSSTGPEKQILASGKWMRNVHGNGWHYLSIRSSDFDTTTTNFPKHGIKDVDREYFAQRYLRTMEAIGYLGYTLFVFHIYT